MVRAVSTGSMSKPACDAEPVVGHLGGVGGAHVHGDVEVPRQRRHAAEVIEVAVGHEDRGRGEAELREGLDHDLGLVAGIDDEPLPAPGRR